MSLSTESFSNYLLGLNPHQLIIVSKFIDKTVCPLTMDIPTSPFISPCGHTFDYPSICQALEHNQTCPIDRRPLTVVQLVKNRFVEEFIEQRILVVFLAVQTENFQHNCDLTQKPLFEAVKLPCGHTFSKSGITKWHKQHKYCPLDNKEFAISDIIFDPEKSKLAQEQYPGYLEKVKLFNSSLSLQVTDNQLDDRNLLMKKLFELLTCPLSKNIIETPVIGHCEHTFDISSIQDEPYCPYDNSKLSTGEVIDNRIAKDLLESLSGKLFEETNPIIDVDREDRRGVFLFLNRHTTLEKIGRIAITLGVLNPINRELLNTKYIVEGQYIFDNEIPISQIASLNETSKGIPVLHIMQ